MSIELLDLSSSGIEFHSVGAATANTLSPYVFTLAFGVTRRCWEDDLNFRWEVLYTANAPRATTRATIDSFACLCWSFFFWEFHSWTIISLQRSWKGNRHSLQIIYGPLEWILPFYTHSFPNPELAYFGQLESMQTIRCLKEAFDFWLVRLLDRMTKKLTDLHMLHSF